MIFNILGSLEVLEGGDAVNVGRHQQRAVLAILLLAANRVVPVDRLVSDLWGDHAPDHPVEAIHVYISRLRRALEPRRQAGAPGVILVRHPAGYLLRVGYKELDADRFDTLVVEGQRFLAGGAPEQASRALAQALGLWRGPALAEFTDADFARPAALRLEELRRIASEQRLEAELALGHHAPAAAELEELVNRDPLRERPWELLVLALYRSGRQGEALRALARARSTLVESLGLEPGPNLGRLEQAILHQAPELAWHPPRPPSAAIPTPGTAPRLVGRRHEMARLRAALAASMQGSGGVAVVSGEPGIGKTRLVEELARHAVADGVVTAIASGHDGEGAPPFWPWVQVLRTLFALGPPDAVRTALDRRADAIAPVVAEALDLAPGAAVPPAVDAETRRARFYDAVVGFVRQLAESRPLLVVLEDLHWDDVASLELTALLSTQLGDSRLLLVVTHRNVGLAAHHPLVNLLSVTARLPHSQFVELSGLSLSEVEEFLTNAIGREPDNSLLSTIFEKTAGNPFFVTELSRLLTSEAVAEGDIAGVIPHRVRAVVRRRMARLDEATNNALGLASVVGAEFDFDTVAHAGALDNETLLHAIESALAAGLIVESPNSVGRYRFSHSIVRDSLYEAISGLRRAKRHARVAEALAAATHGDPDLALAVAYHYAQAAPAIGPDLGIAHLLRAADLANARMAYEQAGEHLQRALQLVATMASGPQRSSQELEVQNRIAISATFIRGFADPRVDEAWAKTAALAHGSDDSPSLIAALWGSAALALGRAQLGVLDRSGKQLIEAAATDASSAPLLSVAGHLALGMSLFHRGQLADAVDHLERARGGCALLGNRSLDVFILDPEVYSLGYLAWARWLLGDFELSARLAEESITSGSKSVQPFSLIAALTLDCLLAATRLDADMAYLRAVDVNAGGRTHDGTLLAALVEIWASVGQGKVNAPGSSDFKERQGRLASSGWRLFGPLLLGLRARVHELEGSPADALAAIDEALIEIESTEQHFCEAELLRQRSELLALHYPDRIAEASEALARALTVAQAQGAQAFVSRVRETKAALRLEVNDAFGPSHL